MFQDGKNILRRGKKGEFALTQNLVKLIILLVILGLISIIVFNYTKGILVPLK